MTIRRFDSSYSDDEALNRVQKSLEESIGFLRDVTILDGKLVTSDITTAGTDIVHGLGRAYKGFMVVKTDKDDGTAFTGSINEDISSDNTIYLKLDTSANVTVTVWVF